MREPNRSPFALALMMVAIMGLVACTGSIGILGSGGGTAGGLSSSGGGAGGGAPGSVGGGAEAGGGYASLRDCSFAKGTPGHYVLRRLTNQEYSNTVQDLLFTQQSPGGSFQETPQGASGFRNDSLALPIYSALVGKYYDAATALAQEVLTSKGVAGGAWSKLVTCNTAQASCAQSTVSALAKRALRRATTAEDLDATAGLMAVFNAGGSFDQGVYDVIVALLMHPEFLMIPVVDPQSLDPEAAFPLDDFELASRLSYFLWQSMPDDALFAVASNGTLHTPSVLATQVKRLLSDVRASHLKTVLRDEWADLSFLAKTDFAQLGQSNTLRDAMIGETDAFLKDVLTNDRSPLTFLTSRQSFVNKTLADFYGLTFPGGADPQSYIAVASERVGMGSHASVLTNTAGGSPVFTNPIKRGHWLTKKLYCDEPPAPGIVPPALPAVSQDTPTIRERIQVHSRDPGCAGCHHTMDALGLGAEGFDSFGRTRTTYVDMAHIDSSGAFPDGTVFADTASMYLRLSEQPMARSCVAQQFLKLGLSRDLSTLDELCLADAAAESTVTEGGHLSDLLVRLTQDKQFLQQAGEAP